MDSFKLNIILNEIIEKLEAKKDITLWRDEGITELHNRLEQAIQEIRRYIK